MATNLNSGDILTPVAITIIAGSTPDAPFECHMTRNLREYDLQELLSEIIKRYPSINTIVLFGSRNYGTGSDRSDVDLIVRHDHHIKPVELRNLTQELCPALDLFLCRDNVAISCANESSVSADSFDALVKRLDGTILWTRASAFNDNFTKWKFQIPVGVAFVPTAALLSFELYESWAPRIREFMECVERSGFPSKPFIGVTARDVAEAMVEALRGAVTQLSKLDPRGSASAIRLTNEYDIQNLFHLVCKSWLPNLAREEVTIRYDGQDKIADFNYLDNRIVFEFKHVKDTGTKAAVVKTLSGLTEFYVAHPNISILVNVVLVEPSVELDDRRWETDYSFPATEPEVWTTIVRNNG